MRQDWPALRIAAWIASFASSFVSNIRSTARSSMCLSGDYHLNHGRVNHHSSQHYKRDGRLICTTRPSSLQDHLYHKSQDQLLPQDHLHHETEALAKCLKC